MSDNSLPEPNQELPKQKKIGRPTIFTQDIADEICKRMANGETLRKIVLDDHMPVSSAIYRWLDTNQIFKEQYTQARIKQADYYAEMIVDEAFNSHDAAIGRLRMDALKWAALTYVVAAIASIVTLVQYILIYLGARDRD